MPLLCEYVITHDVFDIDSYVHEEVGTARIEYIKDVFLEEALIRNLRSGEWLKHFRNDDRSWHNRGLELLKKMVKQNRLRLADPALPDTPSNDSEWCREALASHNNDPTAGIISTHQVVNDVGPNPFLGRIDRLGSFPCWTNRSPSVRPVRCQQDYMAQLQLIMNTANSFMFIDPHLDPSLPRYNDVLPLLLMTKDRNPHPLIEIHRVVYMGSGKHRQIIDPAEWENRFKSNWSAALSSEGLNVDVFIWDDHHDRYLITDLIGVEMGNGFDTTQNPQAITTWSRIGRKDRDDIQREFDPACNRHTLRHHFKIP